MFCGQFQITLARKTPKERLQRSCVIRAVSAPSDFTLWIAFYEFCCRQKRLYLYFVSHSFLHMMIFGESIAWLWKNSFLAPAFTQLEWNGNLVTTVCRTYRLVDQSFEEDQRTRKWRWNRLVGSFFVLVGFLVVLTLIRQSFRPGRTNTSTRVGGIEVGTGMAHYGVQGIL